MHTSGELIVSAEDLSDEPVHRVGELDHVGQEVCFLCVERLCDVRNELLVADELYKISGA